MSPITFMQTTSCYIVSFNNLRVQSIEHLEVLFDIQCLRSTAGEIWKSGFTFKDHLKPNHL